MRTPPLTVIARSPCDEAIQGPRAVAPGLLRCARNDGEVDGAILGHRLCQTTSCRDSFPVSRLFNALQAGKFPSRYFRSVASVDGDAADSGTRPGASVGRRVAAGGRDSFRVSRLFNALQAGKFPLPCNNEIFLGTPEPPFVSRRSARSAAPLQVYHILWLRGFRRPYHFRARIQSFSRRWQPIPRQLRPSLTMRRVSERGALLPSGGESRTALKPQWRSSSAIGAIIMGMGRSRPATVVWSARGPRGAGSLGTQGHGAGSKPRYQSTISPPHASFGAGPPSHLITPEV